MHLDIHALNFPMTDAIRTFASERLKRALPRQADRKIRRISVRLMDINGARGGIDKSCRIVVRLRRGKTVVTRAIASDLYAAIDVASDRMRHALLRHLQRRRTLARSLWARSGRSAALPLNLPRAWSLAMRAG